MATNSHAIHRCMLSHAALGSDLGWVGRVGVDFLFGGGFLAFLKLFKLKVIFCTVCLTMPLTRHLKILTSFSRLCVWRGLPLLISLTGCQAMRWEQIDCWGVSNSEGHIHILLPLYITNTDCNVTECLHAPLGRLRQWLSMCYYKTWRLGLKCHPVLWM